VLLEFTSHSVSHYVEAQVRYFVHIHVSPSQYSMEHSIVVLSHGLFILLGLSATSLTFTWYRIQDNEREKGHCLPLHSDMI
jgi:hypothetical protein